MTKIHYSNIEKSSESVVRSSVPLSSYIYFILALIIGVLNDVITKYLIEDIPSQQIAFLRFASGGSGILLYILFKIFFRRYQLETENKKYTILHEIKDNLKTNYIKIHFIRGFILVFGLVIWNIALLYLPLGLVTILGYTIPFFSIFLSKVILKDKIGLKRILLICIGFIGSILALYDSIEQNIYIKTQDIFFCLLFLLSPFSFALLDIINKKLLSSGKEGAIQMIFYSAFFGSLVSLPLNIKYWAACSAFDYLSIFFIGNLGNLLLYCILKAFEKASIKDLAYYRYFEIFFSLYLGHILFNDHISQNSILGIIIILISWVMISRNSS